MKHVKHLKLILLSCLLLIASVLGTFAFNAGGAKAATLTTASTLAQAACKTCTWKIVASPNGSSYSYLYGVAGVSSKDVWAVGSQVQHWNGKKWKIVNANLSSSQNLNAVAAISTTNVWAVGNDVSTNLPLAEQWNGTQWNVVVIPSPSNSGGAILKGIAAVSANDIWAAGSYYDTTLNISVTLIEHYDGTQWSIVSSPNPGIDNNALSAISAVSANDVWAVGTYGSVPKSGSLNYKTLVEHYDGTQWSVVASPNPSSGENIELYGVSATAQNDAWAVGSYLDQTSKSYRGLIEHWNGTDWTISAKPTAPNLYGVVAISANDVWVVGGTFSKSVEQTFTEHWNGKKWSVVASPNPSGSSGSVFDSVTSIPGSSHLWAVGIESTGGESTLTEVYC